MIDKVTNYLAAVIKTDKKTLIGSELSRTKWKDRDIVYIRWTCVATKKYLEINIVS